MANSQQNLERNKDLIKLELKKIPSLTTMIIFWSIFFVVAIVVLMLSPFAIYKCASEYCIINELITFLIFYLPFLFGNIWLIFLFRHKLKQITILHNEYEFKKFFIKIFPSLKERVVELHKIKSNIVSNNITSIIKREIENYSNHNANTELEEILAKINFDSDEGKNELYSLGSLEKETKLDEQLTRLYIEVLTSNPNDNVIS